jgi:isocitrate dehydrogenase
MDKANLIENALLYTLSQGAHTGDFGDKSKPSLNTTDFANTIIANLGKEPETNKARETSSTSTFHLPTRPNNQKVTATPRAAELVETVVGADLFLEFNGTADLIAPIIQKHLNNNFKLVMISNRGTQVWPTGSVFTECVDQYRVRIEAINGHQTSLSEIYELTGKLTQDIFITSVEVLRKFGDKAGYSLAQGQ